MKNLKILYGIVLFLFIYSCDENEILKENPIDFYSTDNSYVTEADFKIAINHLYDQVRSIHAIRSGELQTWTTDIVFKSSDNADADLNSPNNTLVPSHNYVILYWSILYKIIYDANVIINRIDSKNTDFETDENRMLLKAEAKFFRAYAYRCLACIYGGVPLVLEEIKGPKRDFVRSTRDETWQQCVTDLEDAAQHLPDADNVEAPGRICDAAAYHLLAEIYISLKQWDDAISAANKVINSGKFSLMTERFGTLANMPGDVYWDLFRKDNQNRTSGNMESIWVIQYDGSVQTLGGGGQDDVEKRYIPRYMSCKGPDGKNLFLGPTTQNCGRGGGFMQPNKYVENYVWVSDWDNDIRNSKYNIIRDLVADNPKSAYYGKSVVQINLINSRDYLRNWYPLFAKASTQYQHPDELYLDKTIGLLSGDAGHYYTDRYTMRLAETYLLRAEAYLGKGDLSNAASDINVVRNRANANPVSPNDVTIDYILDERVRELYIEEMRMFTLSRLGLNYERKKKYCDRGSDQISPHHNLWPIPYSEIERNTEVKLEQNPGYDQ